MLYQHVLKYFCGFAKTFVVTGGISLDQIINWSVFMKTQSFSIVTAT